MKLCYTSKARSDVECAFAWYEKQRRGLGSEFLTCIEATLMNVQAYPEMYEYIYADFRRASIRRFPFSVFYTIEKEIIIVHAVFDNRQDPEKMERRIINDENAPNET